jgi:propanol-preferring alcohol dehydrogenase
MPKPGAHQVLVRVQACGVCRTDLHIVDGELTRPKLPLVLGHQIVGTVAELGEAVEGLCTGQSVGIPWLGGACGHCRQCHKGQENLCENAVFTGYSQDGGFAQYTLASGRYALPMPAGLSELEAAPLLCAGLIGYRALRMTGDAERLGLYGFGSAAHIITQVARFQGREVLAITRPGDIPAQQFAASLGATWAGGSDEDPPFALDAAIIFAPVGALVPRALRALAPGGRVVCAGIYMSEIPPFPYELLWQERSIRSVANLTRQDGVEFLELAPRVPVTTHVERYPLDDAERALDDLRAGRLNGSAVLEVGG